MSKINEENKDSIDNESQKPELELEQNDKLAVKAHYDNKEKIAVASTDVQDRHGEKIDQEGWDLKNFKSNPVMLWAHDHHEIAVGNCRNIHIERKNGTPRLVFTPDFHEETDKARALKALYEAGRLNSFSVGFIPKDFDGKESKYLKQELLEISAVNVPANPDARMMSYKSLLEKGFEDSVARDVTGVTEEDEVKPEEAPEEKQDIAEEKVKVGEMLKGALQDEVEENQKMREKYELMEPVMELYWSLLDVYFDDETEVEDFSKLINEFVGMLQESTKSIVKSEETSEAEEETKETEDVDVTPTDESKVLDKDNTLDKDDNKQTSDSAKTQEESSVAPDETSEEEKRAKQSLHKTIATASDEALRSQKLGDEDKTKTIDMLKVIKRANEILIKHNKGQK